MFPAFGINREGSHMFTIPKNIYIYMTDQLDASDDICFKFFITVYLTQLLDLNFVLNLLLFIYLYVFHFVFIFLYHWVGNAYNTKTCSDRCYPRTIAFAKLIKFIVYIC